MKILLASNNFLSAFKNFFPEDDVSVIEDNDDKADLLIFPGGEDIDPRRYLDKEEFDSISYRCHWNTQRDNREEAIFNSVISGKIIVPNILGVCRGLQAINVFLGGSLVPDLATEDKSHRSIHNIIHTNRSVFTGIAHVNSLHHQAILRIGTQSLPRMFYQQVLALEPNTNIIEIMQFLESVSNRKSRHLPLDKFPALNILGLQFHPEFFPDSPEPGSKLISKKAMASLIKKWMETRYKL